LPALFLGAHAVRRSENTGATWTETVAVKTNTAYSYFVGAAECNIDGSDPAKFSLYVNGISNGPIFHLSSTTGVWTDSSTVWFSGNSTVARLELRLGTTQPSGNDFALDDFSFGEPTRQSKLNIARTGNQVIVSWPSPSIGWTLEQNSNPATTNWTTSSYSISDDGTNRSIAIAPPVGNLFFPLRH
jgi:hypothetical protein